MSFTVLKPILSKKHYRVRKSHTICFPLCLNKFSFDTKKLLISVHVKNCHLKRSEPLYYISGLAHRSTHQERDIVIEVQVDFRCLPMSRETQKDLLFDMETTFRHEVEHQTQPSRLFRKDVLFYFIKRYSKQYWESYLQKEVELRAYAAHIKFEMKRKKIPLWFLLNHYQDVLFHHLVTDCRNSRWAKSKLKDWRKNIEQLVADS